MGWGLLGMMIDPTPWTEGRYRPEEAQSAWRSACEQLHLTASDFEERVNALDQYLDEVEILLDELATQHGLETSTSI